jgi:DNA-binding protein HU-beta
MNKTGLLKLAAHRHRAQQIPKRVYDQVLSELLESIQRELAACRKVHFLGFGTFYTRMRKPAKARNFKTNKVIDVPAVRLPAFRPGSLLKQAVRRKKGLFGR